MKGKCLRFIIQPFQGPWLEGFCGCWLERVPLLLLWASEYSELGLCPFPMVFPGRCMQKPLQIFTTATQGHRGEIWNSCAYQCSRQQQHKKKYSKTLWLPIVAIIFEVLLYARYCTRYLPNIPHNTIENMYYLVNAADEGWNLASNPVLFETRVSVLSIIIYYCGTLQLTPYSTFNAWLKSPLH